MPEIFKSFTDSIEKVFRYLVPGVFLFVCVICAYPDVWCHCLNKLPTVMMLLLIFSTGLIWFVTYRGILTVFELVILFRTGLTAVSLFKNHGSKIEARWAQFIIIRQRIRIEFSELSNYLDIRWSFVHLFTQSSIMFFIFSRIHADNATFFLNLPHIRLVSAIVLVIAIVQHGWMYYVEKKVIQNFLKDDKNV
jgi:hypothetical protein